MKTIKVKFVDWWDTFNPETNLMYEILKKNYDVQISDNPDYLFCSVYSKEFMKYDCVKILYSAENFAPDFNLFDYAIGFENLIYPGRYLYFPNYLMNLKYKKDLEKAKNKHLATAIPKNDFCSLVVSSGSKDQTRIRFFEELCNYKKVNSGGKYLNNIGCDPGDGVTNKLEFQSRHKFALAFENSSHPGYCTEKLVEAFSAGTVPIYWGDPDVCQIFNEKAMIVLDETHNFRATIDKIKAIDNDDALYNAMLKEPALIDLDVWEKWSDKLELFLIQIIEKPIQEAHRTSTIPLVKKYYLPFLNINNQDTGKKYRNSIIERTKHLARRIWK